MMNKQDEQQPTVKQFAMIWNYNAHVEHQHNYFGGKEQPADDVADDVNGVDDEPAEEAQKAEETKVELNYFAPKKNLQMLLREAWFGDLRTDKRFDEQWTDDFVAALMASEWRDGIAQDWACTGVRNKRTQIKGHVVGLLKDAHILKGSYDSIAREVGAIDNARLFSRYMSDGKKQVYADWVLDYVAEK